MIFLILFQLLYPHGPPKKSDPLPRRANRDTKTIWFHLMWKQLTAPPFKKADITRVSYFTLLLLEGAPYLSFIIIIFVTRRLILKLLGLKNCMPSLWKIFVRFFSQPWEMVLFFKATSNLIYDALKFSGQLKNKRLFFSQIIMAL